jgi:hypothetical protein
VVQATTILGLGLLFTVFLIEVVNLLCLENKKLLSRVAGVLAVVAGKSFVMDLRQLVEKQLTE